MSRKTPLAGGRPIHENDSDQRSRWCRRGAFAMLVSDDPDQQEPENPELARKRAEVLERFLREKPWEKSLEERHKAYLALRGQDLPADDLGEYTASLVTGLPHVGRQGYSGSDKPPFDLAA